MLVMIEQCDLSERRACRLVGLSRDSYRHPPEVDAMTQELSGKIIEIAHARRRFGYRRIHDLLHPEFPDGQVKFPHPWPPQIPPGRTAGL